MPTIAVAVWYVVVTDIVCSVVVVAVIQGS